MKIFLFSTGFSDFVIELANSLSVDNKVILTLPGDRIRTKEYISFLSTALRAEFGFGGVPVRVVQRLGKREYR